MTYTVLYLEDTPSQADAIGREIANWDSDARVVCKSTIDEVKQMLNECSDIPYVIVDLHLYPATNEEAGDSLISWILAEQHLSEPLILAISKFECWLDLLDNEVLKKLEKHKRKRVYSVHYTNGYRTWKDTLHKVIEEARLKYLSS